MAFPTVAATNGGTEAGNTSHTINLPAGIGVGDLLIVLFGCDLQPTITWPAGWTQLWISQQAAFGFECRYRVADGTEGATITITTDSSLASGHISYRVEGHNSSTNAPVAGTAAAGASAIPDPPSLSPAGGAADYLWLAAEVNDRGDRTASAYPTNYSNGQNRSIDVTTGINLASAERQVNGATEDPGTFTISAGDGWRAQTLAVYPGTEGNPSPAAVHRTIIIV